MLLKKKQLGNYHYKIRLLLIYKYSSKITRFAVKLQQCQYICFKSYYLYEQHK